MEDVKDNGTEAPWNILELAGKKEEKKEEKKAEKPAKKEK